MKTSSGERALFDTNVLVYAANSSAPYHQSARELRDRAVAGDFAACVTPQVLLEYVAVVTSAKRVAAPVGADEAWAAAARIASVFEVLDQGPDLVADLAAQGQALGIKGPQVFDLAIALTALGAGVHTIYTYDSSVFSNVPGITAREP